jgi:hypothetical protein
MLGPALLPGWVGAFEKEVSPPNRIAGLNGFRAATCEE